MRWTALNLHGFFDVAEFVRCVIDKHAWGGAKFPELEAELAEYACNWRATYSKMLKSKIASSSEII